MAFIMTRAPFNLFKLGGAIKEWEKEGDSVNQLMSEIITTVLMKKPLNFPDFLDSKDHWENAPLPINMAGVYNDCFLYRVDHLSKGL